ncbi:MAG: YceI family protein [Flavisolibacter sp.]|nr:YceI family protein [Flavisolibacter sp.]
MVRLIINCLSGLLLCLPAINADAQRFYTKTARIEFLSKAPLEDIRAVNKTAAAIMDIKTGAIQYAVLMKGFEFKKALMQEHFNENYIESDQYPKAEFKGVITNNSEINYSKNGTYPAIVNGTMTIHGVTKTMKINGTIQIENGVIFNHTNFSILLSDFNVSIPAVVKDNISSRVAIIVAAKLDPVNK